MGGACRRHVGWCRHRSFPGQRGYESRTLATAWGGVSSLQVGFRAVLTGAMRRGLSLTDVVRWMSCNTARLVGLDDRGDITPVLRADLAIIRRTNGLLWMLPLWKAAIRSAPAMA